MPVESKPPSVVVVGGGGHGRVVISALLAMGRDVMGVVDPKLSMEQSVVGIPMLGDDDVLSNLPVGEIELANGIGSSHDPSLRRALFDRWTQFGHRFAIVCHPSAVVGTGVRIGQGAQLMAGVIVQTGSAIGRNSILNSGATIDHDCVIGDHVHIAPGATLSGGVNVGDSAHIGVGASVVQGVSIGNGAIIGAGAAVVANVPSGVTAVGVPAKFRHG